MLREFFLAALLRIVLIAYGEWQDSNLKVKYTDVDYDVFTDAARLMSRGQSPYERKTFRYSPLLALILQPNIFLHRSFGKVVFSTCDLLIAGLLERLLATRKIPFSESRLYISAGWLFNPVTVAVSSRGNAESVLGVLVLLTFVLVLEKHLVLGGVAYALAIHFKLYPVIYSLPLYLFLDSHYTGRDTKSLFVVSIVPNRPRWIYVLTVGITLTVITIAFYGWSVEDTAMKGWTDGRTDRQTDRQTEKINTI
jgi:phosphatidylinositol glycan class M